jgi:hypothetical protein
METKTLILLQNGREIACTCLVFHRVEAKPQVAAAPRGREAVSDARVEATRYLTAVAALPVNTAAATYARIGDAEVPVPFIRGASRKVITTEIRIDDPNASALALALALRLE